jgi:integral membrane sensor domain MASE1
MNLQPLVQKRNQFRAVLCGHKAVEAGGVCLLLMVQGHLGAITMTHLAVASKTGVLAIIPVLFLSFTSHARHFLNRWTTAAFLGICTFLADAIVHESHYPGEYTEALLTGLGAAIFSIVVSYTPIGKRIDNLAEHFLDHYSGDQIPRDHE